MNSPNPSSVYIRLCRKHKKKVFYCFYKNQWITFPRKNSLLWHWLKEKFLPDAKSCTQSLARIISSCIAKRSTIQNTDFSCLKCQLKWKKWHTFFETIIVVLGKLFSKFQLTEESVNKVNLSSFELKNLFKFMLAWLAREKQNILMPQPCLHTLMQTCKWSSCFFGGKIQQKTLTSTIQILNLRLFGFNK